MTMINTSINMLKNITFIIDSRLSNKEALDMIHLVMDREYLSALKISSTEAV